MLRFDLSNRPLNFVQSSDFLGFPHVPDLAWCFLWLDRSIFVTRRPFEAPSLHGMAGVYIFGPLAWLRLCSMRCRWSSFLATLGGWKQISQPRWPFQGRWHRRRPISELDRDVFIFLHHVSWCSSRLVPDLLMVDGRWSMICLNVSVHLASSPPIANRLGLIICDSVDGSFSFSPNLFAWGISSFGILV
jgi:hypothetical protein